VRRDPLQLDYAPPAPRRLRLRRWLTIAFVLLALWAMAEWGPDTARRVRLVWVQSRCAGFEFSPRTVIFDTDPTAGAALLTDPSNYVAINDAQVWPLAGVARREPDCWVSLKDILFAGRNFWPPGPAAPKALVHRLRSISGEERLVAIIVAPDLPLGATASPVYSTRGIGLVAAVVRPGGWNTSPRWDGNSKFLRAGFETAHRLRFFAGELNPADPSRFTVPYEMDGQSGIVDGKLENDGNVSLTVRDGPARPGG
jgi:hypothetical protein